MRSHEYQLRAIDCLRAVLPTALVVGALVFGLHFADRHGMLPAVPQAWDPEMTVLNHQSLAARQAAPAEIVLVGDSTCLAGVDAKYLSQELPGRPKVLSLALFIWLGIDTYAEALSDYAAARPNSVRTVVLLVTPTKLTTLQGKDGNELWHRVHSNTEATTHSVGSETPLTASQIFRRHVLSHCLATPLRGHGAGYFGFASEIDAYMSDHRGSLPGIGTFVPPRARPSGTPSPVEYVLLPEMRQEGADFRKRLPAGAKLYLGLTPGIANTVDLKERARRVSLLKEWDASVHADGLLTNLPPTLPFLFFSLDGHLNEAGQKVFTRSLARQLAPLLNGPNQQETKRRGAP